MTTCIRRGKMYQTVPFIGPSKPGISGACVGCAAEGDDELCMSLPEDCSEGVGNVIWNEIKNGKTNEETTVRERDRSLETT